MNTIMQVKRSASGQFFIGRARVTKYLTHVIERTIPELKESMKLQVLKESGVQLDEITVVAYPVDKKSKTNTGLVTL
jgi:hypothetical protein